MSFLFYVVPTARVCVCVYTILTHTPLHACADPSSPPTRSGYRPSDAVAFLAIEPRLRIESMILLIYISWASFLFYVVSLNSTTFSVLSPTPLHACADPSSPPTRSGYRPSDAVAFLAIEPRLRIESMILLILDAVLDDATVRLLSAALKREKANSVANIVATS